MVNCPSKPLKQGGITVDIFFVRGRNLPFKFGKGTLKSRIQQTLKLSTDADIITVDRKRNKTSWGGSIFFVVQCFFRLRDSCFNIEGVLNIEGVDDPPSPR